MRPTWSILACLTVLLAGSSLLARPPHKKALADHFGAFLPRHLNDCRTCHLPESPTGKEEDKPHNKFGARLKDVRKELRDAKKDVDIIARLKAIADEDSDGDGVSNLLELLAGHNPGEPQDRPSPAQIERARKVLVAFNSRKPYPWKPFEAVGRPNAPRTSDGAWVRNPIDAFIAAEHELHDVKPRPEAPRHVLVRRVWLDLLGLPPTPEELQAALNHTSPDWYEKVVDRLLASPHHGERWARHWMDVWRYVDFSNSGLQDGWTGVPNMWRWRDWIIASLNSDKGYDRMVQEMLAADELCPADPDSLAATCYLARNKGNNRDAWLHDSVNHAARAFLGMTVECARCHTHPYDSIEQEEYYRLRAIFEPYGVRTEPAPDQPDTKKGGGLTRVFDQNLNPRTFFYIRGVEQNPDKDRTILPGVPKLLGDKGFTVTTVPLPNIIPERHPRAIAETRAERKQEVADAAAALHTLAQTAKEGPLAEALLAGARVRLQLAEANRAALEAILRVEDLEENEADKNDRKAWEEAAQAADAAQRQAARLDAQWKKLSAHLAVLRQESALNDLPSDDAKARQNLDQLRKALADAEKALARAEDQARQPPTTRFQRRFTHTTPRTSTGRRLGFARWITSRENPLAARVAVNHIWLRHFGTPLVSSVFDFGAGGQPPSHPALVDWLAAEFMAQNWSMKHLHKLIVTSNTYRMSSTPDPGNLQVDPDNQFYWRMPSRRMEAEVVRDSILHLAGNLDPKPGGPEIDTKLGLQVMRRSIYFKFTQSDYLKEMESFDVPSADDCYCRGETIAPQQALTLLNSELALAQSRLLARSLLQKVGADPAEFVRAAFAQVLSRPATAAEEEACLRYIADQTKFLEENKNRLGGGPGIASKGSTDPVLRVRENLVHLLLNHHDFVTIR